MKTTNMSNDIFLILKLLTKWKKLIILILIISFISTYLFTFLIKPKYSSEAVIYPVNLSKFSQESNTEQMIQILKSNYIFENIYQKYNLDKHYNIDKSKSNLRTLVFNKYRKNVLIKKTEYESVRISVIDIDPDTAVLITNSIINYYNQKVRSMHRLKLKELMEVNRKQAFKWKTKKDSLEKEIYLLNSKYGIINCNLQIEKLTEGIYRSNGNTKLINKAESQIKTINEYGAEYNFINSNYNKVLDLYFKYKLSLEQQIIEYNKEITYANIVIEPYPADEHCSPKRLLIALISTFSLFVLIIITITFIERKNN